jgi:hypothetical protein
MRLCTALGVSLVVSLAFATTEKSRILNVPLNLKLGLWQMTYTTEGDGVRPLQSIAPELLAKMTPEQRARTEARLKARVPAGSRIETKQYCLTEEKLKKAIFNSAFEIQNCRRTVFNSTARLQQFREECLEDGSTRTSDARFEALELGKLKGSIKVKSDGATAYAMNVEIEGRWLAADCGNAQR